MNHIELENFAYNIVWLRKHYGISKKKMAQLLKVGLWTINKLEKGEFPPGLKIDILFTVQKEFRILPADQLSHKLGE